MQNYEPNELENLPSPSIKRDIFPSASLPVSPNNPPWNGWSALGVWLASVAFIVIFPNLFLLPYLSKLPLDFSNQAAILEFAKTDPTAILLQLSAVIPAHILTFILAWLVVTKFRRFSFRETLGWERNGFKVWHAFVILGIFYVVAVLLAKTFGETETDFDRIIKSSRAALYLVAFFATFTAPLVEEVVYRGILYSAFQRKFGVILAVLFVTVLFTAIHIPQYSNDNVPNYASIITLLLLSLTLTLIRVRTDNLLPCIILHTVVNGVQSLLLLLYPYIERYVETHPSQAASLIQIFK